MSDKNPERNEIADHLRKLCNKICPNKEMGKAAFRIAVANMAAMQDCRRPPMEDVICHQIQERLLRLSSAQHVDKFVEYHQQLKTSFMLKNRSAILEFLYALSPPEFQELESQRRRVHRELSKVSHLTSPSSNKFDENRMKFPQSISNVNCIDTTAAYSYNIPSVASLSIKDSSLNRPLLHTMANKSNNKIFDDSLVSEREMIQDVLYAAQGVKKNDLHQGNSCRGKAGIVARISELGFLHDKICYYMDPSSGHMPIGLVGEGLVSAFRNELTEYYRSLAILQSQLNSSTSTQGGTLTLRRLLVWSLEPLNRLKWLATIGHACQNKKGGELVSCVHKFSANGDPRVTTLMHQLLSTVCYPLYVMLCRWLLDGEIDDPHNEFFIDSRSKISTERLWHDKYRVRETMLPSFISKQQAQHILATGKSLTFLREVCGDREQLSERETLKRVLDNSSVELLFSGGSETKLHAVMSSAYLGVSRRLLDTLLGPNKLLQHLQALRGYLLLGHGDFIQMLMVLIEPELNKNASQLYVHNLRCILETAIRTTNAQYDDPDIINRLYVNLFPPSAMDIGWDVFSLFYRVEGPLGTVLEPNADTRYRTLFSHLWRAKRMEYILSQMWKKHTIEYKKLSKMLEVMPLLQRLHALRSEMVHFVKELQYALFVVIECAWEGFLASANRAVALDQLLVAHKQFLTLLSDATKEELQDYLRNVYDEILSFKHFETNLYHTISEEYQRRQDIENLKEQRCKKGEYGITTAEEQKHAKDMKIFTQYLNEKKADFNVLSRTYRNHVKEFLLKLALQNEASLQFLLFRLDYNDYYKRGDSKLHEPLTYQHKRLSEIGLAQSGRQNGTARKLDTLDKKNKHTERTIKQK